jgi:hypothetical protein
VTDVIGAFCSGIGLNATMCDFLRSAFDLLGINPNNLADDLREKGKDQLCAELVELIGADYPGGDTAARNLCDDVLGRIEASLTGGTPPPTSPKAPSTSRLAMIAAQVATTSLVHDDVAGTSNVVYRCRDGKPTCVAEWPGGSRVLALTACKNLTPPDCPPAFPADTIAAQDGDFIRVAVPRPPTTGPGSSYVEVAAQAAWSDLPPDVKKVMLRDLLRQTGQLPLHKDPWFWAIAAGSVTALGTALWMRKRRG